MFRVTGRGGFMSCRLIIYLSAILLTLLGGVVYADSSNRHVRVSYVEGDATIYPSDGERPSDLQRNVPVLDRDEIETRNGRVELAFRNGIIVRVGDYSSVRIESTYSPMILELLSGNLYVDSRIVDNFREELEVRAGDAQVYLIDEGNMRVDLGKEGTVRVSALQGEVEVRGSGGRVLLQQGERTYVDPSSTPESPEVFDRDYDEFDDWNESRMDSAMDRYGDYREDRYVDDSIYYDAYDLYDYGDWRAYGSFGNVWVPHVSYGWRPYNDGRWMYFNSGWFWHSYEPWGWAPYHYGRWGWGLDIGWYWIPGYTFAPSWVSWYDYGDYLGWCPLNYWNRPIFFYNDYRNNYPLVQKQKTRDVTDAWTFVHKDKIGNSNIKKIRLEDTVVKSIKLDPTRVVKTPRKEIATYVMPKTTKVPGFLNDKKVVKVPTDDIENPNGLKHRNEDIDGTKRPSERVKTPRTPEPIQKTPKSSQYQQDRDVKIVPRDRDADPNSRDRDAKTDQFKTVRPRESGYDRDQQFKRTFDPRMEQRRPLGPYVSPYYRERQRNDNLDRNYENLREVPWYRDPNSYKDEDREVSPRYLDEAKKIFERLNNNKDGDRGSSYGTTKRSEPRNEQRPQIQRPQPSRNQPTSKSRTTNQNRRVKPKEN